MSITISTNMNQPINLETITSYCEPIDPLSDYLDSQPGEDEFIDNLIEEYGDYLEKLTKREKLFILGSLANKVGFEEPGVVVDSIYQLVQACYFQMSLSDLLAFMGALCEQTRWGHYAETTTEQTLQHTGSVGTHENS
jgi:hypothetical protein